MPEERPNIIILYADDLGFGDIGCYGATHIATPNIDRLATQGLRFEHGYAAAATCTPSRYSLLTGEYPWRNDKAHILAGDAPMIIAEDQATLPKTLQTAGYRTGVIGKWHLGMGAGDLNWNHDISPAPLDVGFDHSFVMAATNDRVPCVYIDGRAVSGLEPDDPIEVAYCRENPFPNQPTGRDNPELLRVKYSHGHDMSIVNGISRIGYMQGGSSALWDDETMADVFLQKAVQFIEENREQPFFLYYAFHQPHVPRVPSPRFAGATELGPRGDVIVEMDWCVGQVLDALTRLGLDEETIVVFSSDNGPVLDDGYEDQAKEKNNDHTPAGALRGGKYSLFDGGTRVPFIIRWPSAIQPGVSSALVSHIDFFASFARLIGAKLPHDGAADSEDVLDALLGHSEKGRTELVVEGQSGKTALRQASVVCIPAYQGPAVSPTTGIEFGYNPSPQLYDLEIDMGQREDLAASHPETVTEMLQRLDEIKSRSGTRQGYALDKRGTDYS